jgi:hypothetical protein
MHAASRPSSRSQGIRQANPLRSTGASICAIAFASGFDGEPRAIVAANAVLVGMARDGVMKLAPHISQRATRCAADRTVLCLLSLDRSLDCGATIPLKIECKASNVIGQNAGQNVVSSGIGVPHNLLSLLINLCECLAWRREWDSNPRFSITPRRTAEAARKYSPASSPRKIQIPHIRHELAQVDCGVVFLISPVHTYC